MADIRLAGEAVFEETADLDEEGEDDDGVIEASPRKQIQVLLAHEYFCFNHKL